MHLTTTLKSPSDNLNTDNEVDLNLPTIRLLNTVAWLPLRFLDCITTPLAKYEASMYGPFNAVLHHLFPLADSFMTKPQGLLRMHRDPDHTGGRVSIDSMGGPVFHRRVEEPVDSKEPSPKQPDFLVVKAGPAYGKDLPVVVVEIKRHDTHPHEDQLQMTEYMYRIYEKLRAIEAHPSSFEHFRGYLVERRMTYEYRLPADINDPIVRDQYTFENALLTTVDFPTKIKERADLYRNVVPNFSSWGDPPGNED